MAKNNESPVTPEMVTGLLGEGRRALDDAARTATFVAEKGPSSLSFVGPAIERLSAWGQAAADVTSAFPETVEFLAARGMNHTDQLDKQGKRELTAHLKLVLAYFEARNEDKQRSGTK